jgi:tetratricopeptide (TPR) repeat protein
MGRVPPCRRDDRARLWLDRADAAAGDDPTEAAWIALTSGACRTDLGDYPQADRDLRRAIEVADAAQLAAPAAFARPFQGRLYLLRDELDGAERALRSSIDRATDISWTSMIPWPESLLAEVHMRRGDVDTAAECSSTRSPWAGSSVTRAGRAWALVDSVSWRSGATISTLACTCSNRPP